MTYWNKLKPQSRLISFFALASFLSSCENKELQEQSVKNQQIISQLEAQYKLLLEDNSEADVPDPSDEATELQQQLDDTHALIKSTEEEIAARQAEKEKIEKDTEDYRSKYSLRSE